MPDEPIAPVVPDQIVKKRKATREELIARLGDRSKAGYRTAAQIIVAMIANKCDKVKAAAELRMSVDCLNNRIYKSKDLKTRFGAEAIRMRAMAEADAADRAKSAIKLRSEVFEHKMDEFVIGQAKVAQIILDQLIDFQVRIRNGAECRRLTKLYQKRDIQTLSQEQKEFMAQWAYEDRDEEAMLLKYELACIQEYHRSGEITAELAYKKAATQMLIKRMGGKVVDGKDAEIEKPKKPMLSNTPKGMAPSVPPPRLTPVPCPSNQIPPLNGNTSSIAGS